MQRKDKYSGGVYLRLSKEDGDVVVGTKSESNSISNQKSLITEFLKSKPEIHAVSFYEDDGYSGVNFERPAFQRMMADIKKGKIDCIIVKDLSRFGRNYIEVGRYLEKLFPMLGIRFIAVNDNYDSLNTDTAHDIVMPFKNLINDSYCRDLSVKIRSHLNVKRKNGEFVGAFACYGYLKDPQNKNRLIIDTNAGQIVQDIFRMKINGFSQNRIADVLNKEGILSPMEYKRSLGIRFSTAFKINPKAVWSAKAVSRILSNEIYTGVLVQGKQTTPNHKVKTRQAVEEKDWIRIEDAHPALIDRYLFDIVQTLLERDTRTSPDEKTVFALAGLVFCGDCGQPMVRKTAVYKGKNGKRQTYSYFVCNGKCHGSKCSWHRINEKELMGAVFQSVNLHIENVLDTERALQEIADAPSSQLLIRKLRDRIIKKKEELARTERLKIGAYEDFKDELLDRQEYIKLKQEFDHRLEEARSTIEDMNRQIAELEQDNSDCFKWMEYYKSFGKLEELTRFAAAIAINRILIYEDRRIKIIFNFEDSFGQAKEMIESTRQQEVI